MVHIKKKKNLKHKKDCRTEYKEFISKGNLRTSLVVQWLRPCTADAGDTGSIPGRGTKIPHAARYGQKIKKKKKKAISWKEQ